MELCKYKDNQILPVLKHIRREFLGNRKSFSNKSIDTNLSCNNISLVNIGKSAKELNQLRKELEKDLYIMSRNDINHMIEIVVQAPTSLNTNNDLKNKFFEETVNFVKETFGLTGDKEKYLLVADIHKDERMLIKTDISKNSSDELVNISKDHIHILFLPVIEDTRNDIHQTSSGLKLNSNSLTRKSFLKKLHPMYQEYLKNHNIDVKVHNPKDSNSKKIALSVSQLKYLTNNLGIVLQDSIDLDFLGTIIKENIELKKELALSHETIKELEKTQEHTNNIWGNSLSSWGSGSWNKNRDIDVEK